MGLRAFILALLLGVTGLFCLKSPPLQSGNASGVIMQLPDTLPGFISTKGEPDAIELRELPSDTQFEKRTYYTPTQHPERKDIIHVSIVLSGAERKSIHRPEKCLVAQGWKLVRSRVVTLPLHAQYNLKVTDLFIEKKIILADGRPQIIRAHYLYWFIGHETTTPSHTGRTLISLKDSIFKNRNHRWAYASVLCLVTDNIPSPISGERGRNDAETLEVCSRIIQGILPSVQRDYLARSEPHH